MMGNMQPGGDTRRSIAKFQMLVKINYLLKFRWHLSPEVETRRPQYLLTSKLVDHGRIHWYTQ